MKLRMKDNSIRLRLSQSEVEEFAKKGSVYSSTIISSINKLSYGLSVTDKPGLSVDFRSSKITVLVPMEEAKQWASTDQVGLIGTIADAHNQYLNVLVEKDFKCLTERKGDDESDLFPNPNEPHETSK